jgi:microcystin-dependent protein
MQERWLWQNPLFRITDQTYQDILDMIAQAEFELMNNILIGSIFPSVSSDISDDWLLLDGSLIAQADYPELTSVVPASWLISSDIQLPDMTSKGLFGTNGAGLGEEIGENDHVLTVGELASHNHSQNPHSHSYTLTTGTPTAAGIEPAFADLTFQAPSITGSATASNNPTGSDEAHNNIQASLTVNWFIVAR